MATLEKIRNKAGLLVAVVGLALFSFIIGDLLNSSSSFRNKNQNNVLVVNGNAIDYQEYMSRENELVEQYKIQYGMTNLNENNMSQIRQRIYEDIIMENTFHPRLNELGIMITSQEMTDMVEGENISPVLLQNRMFQNPETGLFDRYTINMMLNNIKNIDNIHPDYRAQWVQFRTIWMFMEKDIKQNRMYEKYLALLSKAVAANSLDAKDAFDNEIISSDIIYTMESVSAIDDSLVSVSAAEIEKLYNERKEMFRQQEACVIDYIAVDIVPSLSDFEQASKEMDAIRAELETTDNVSALTNEKSERKFTNAFFSINGYRDDQEIIDFVTTASVGDIEGPVFKDNQYRIIQLVEKTENVDSVNISILTPAPRSSESETREYVDSILNLLNKGADFFESVQNHSADQFAENGGEVGWMTEAVALQFMNEEFRKTAFSLNTGQSAVVKSTYGLHIIKVTDRTNKVPKYKTADIVYTVTPSSATRSQLYNALNQFIAQNNTAEKIEAAAQEQGYQLTPNVVVHSTDLIVGSVSGARQLVRWTFNNKKGRISDITECDNSFVVAVHKGRQPEGYQSLASVTPQLQRELVTRQKTEELAAKLASKNFNSVMDYAEEMNTSLDTIKFITMSTSPIANIGAEPKLNAYITFAPLNTIQAPVAGNNGVYVFEVINRTNDQHLYVEENQKRTMVYNNSYRIGGLAFQFMQQNAKIEDNRIRFF